MSDERDSGNIRQLCLRLKPILGIKADQIFQAYLAEDDEGKKQIEQYLQLLHAKSLPVPLSQTEATLLPPSQEHAQGEYQTKHA